MRVLPVAVLAWLSLALVARAYGLVGHANAGVLSADFMDSDDDAFLDMSDMKALASDPKLLELAADLDVDHSFRQKGGNGRSVGVLAPIERDSITLGAPVRFRASPSPQQQTSAAGISNSTNSSTPNSNATNANATGVNGTVSTPASQKQDNATLNRTDSQLNQTAVKRPEKVRKEPTPVRWRCPNDCSYNGFCDTEELQCYCRAPYKGKDCSRVTDCPADCSGNGKCVRGVCQCKLGFNGMACERQGCPHDCFHNGVCHQTTCACYSNYTGLYCQYPRGCPNGCNKHGECKNHACYCDYGWTGQGCELKMCPDNCNGRGRCNSTTAECVCDPGFYGAGCEKKRCPNSCSGQGECDFRTGQCLCNPGFFGLDCNPKNCPAGCSGHGTCKFNNKTLRAYCECQPGFVGDGCEQKTCPNDCNQMSLHGRCTQLGCKCTPIWTGPGCAIRQCPYGCLHGRCNNNTWKCECEEGWNGIGCNMKECKEDCNFHGICVNGTCKCESWWKGDTCAEPTCPKDKGGRLCYGHGKCNIPDQTKKTPAQELEKAVNQSANPAVQLAAATGKKPKGKPDSAQCACDEGWGGKDCRFKQCKNNCAGRGICINGECFCEKGFYGPDCTLAQNAQLPAKDGVESGELACSRKCAHGKCFRQTKTRRIGKIPAEFKYIQTAAYACLCESGWAGQWCTESLTQCPDSCKNKNGICKTDCTATMSTPCPVYKGNNKICAGNGVCQTEGTCRCHKGFSGADCSVATCPDNCNGRGLCNTHTQKCVCFAGFTGKTCERATGF